MKMERFEDIEAWQLARELMRKVYDLTNKSKVARDFGLRDKFRMLNLSICKVQAMNQELLF